MQGLPEVPIEQWLSAKQLAAEFFLNEDSAYRWRKSGTIPPDFVGRLKGEYRFHPAIIPFLNAAFEAAHPSRRRDAARLQ
ncbi:MAG TPA: hypothetical protein VGY56_20665 [Verrucomicrobiae bacterium]|nr:hypothetical protein [Verrucomicrobiae bacterium]